MTLSSRIIKDINIKHKGEIKLSSLNEEQNSDIDTSYSESISDEIIIKAKEESEIIIQNAILKSKEIEKKAYQEGYDQGQKNGYEDGYKEVYEEYIEKAKFESQDIINNANEILLNANAMVAEYIKSIQKEMIKTCINISSKVVNKYFEDEKSMNEMLESIIEKYEINGSIIVKCNQIYEIDLKEKIESIMKDNKNIKIFLIVDESIEIGHLVIQKEEGSITVSVENAIEKLREELVGE